MWVLAGLVLLTAAEGQGAILEKPVLTVHPPWATIFRGESVTLHCAGHHALILEPRPIRTLWYRGHLLLPAHTRTLEVQAPGVYRCQTRGAPVSDPVHLSVSNDWLILQAPPAAVFEGDPLVLRCRARADRPVQRLHFYHEGRAVRYYPAGANYTVAQARAGDSGHYQCSGTMRIPAEGAAESAPLFSARVAVRVQELFPAPVLRAAGPGPAGGLVLRCDTRPHPRRRATPLLFAFYRHGRALRAFAPAPELTVPARPAPDLDAYWCEAATASRSVRKRSPWTPPPPPPPPGADYPGDEAPTSAPAAVPGAMELPTRKPPGSRWAAVVPSVPSATPAAGQDPMAGPSACAPQGPPGALGADSALLLSEMRVLQTLLGRVLQELQGAVPQQPTEAPGTPAASAAAAALGELSPLPASPSLGPPSHLCGSSCAVVDADAE